MFSTKKPFAIIQKLDSDQITYLEGDVLKFESLEELKKHHSKLDRKEPGSYSLLSLFPFSQAKEYNYKVKDNGNKIISLSVTKQLTLSAGELNELLPQRNNKVDKLNFELSDEAYEKVVKDIIEKEISDGEGCNFVIKRKLSCLIEDFGLDNALSILKNLLSKDFGTYWKFIFYTGEKYFIGSTPERHIEIVDLKVKMNPISGTYFKKESYETNRQFKNELIDFLTDSKEVNELFMVLDEELKIMSRITRKGGMIVGPLIKEMSKVIHTEYVLMGIMSAEQNYIDILGQSFFAPTVTGSPIENAFKIIDKYEISDRNYYSSALALQGYDGNGREFLDSPILIRTLEIDGKGNVDFSVGATLVKDSVPATELKETKYKSMAVMNALLNKGEDELAKKANRSLMSRVANDDEISILLQDRNQDLSKFWFFNQEREKKDKYINKKALIINNGDDFAHMVSFMLYSLGFKVTVEHIEKLDMGSFERLPGFDFYLVGPGPGDPNDDTEKNKKIFEVIQKVMDKKFMAICFGHQILSRYFGFDVDKLDKILQGEALEIDYFGSKQKFGFYNTFMPTFNAKIASNLKGITYALQDSHVMAMRGKNFASFQFHLESILSKNGFDILKLELERIGFE